MNSASYEYRKMSAICWKTFPPFLDQTLEFIVIRSIESIVRFQFPPFQVRQTHTEYTGFCFEILEELSKNFDFK